MLTANDVYAIPLFSTLPEIEIERLAQIAADVHLAAGEFAVPEGGERALYAVITGKIQVVKLIDGVERTLGWRVPGAIFGEVPLTLGTPFPGGYRASEASRVMRNNAQQYYTLAAAAPDISLKVSALVRERIGGLQGIAAEAPKPRVTMFSHRWDTASADLRRFLAGNQITCEWATPIRRTPGRSGPWSAPPMPSVQCCGWRMARSSLDPARVTLPSASGCRPGLASQNTIQ